MLVRVRASASAMPYFVSNTDVRAQGAQPPSRCPASGSCAAPARDLISVLYAARLKAVPFPIRQANELKDQFVDIVFVVSGYAFYGADRVCFHVRQQACTFPR